MLKTLFLIVSLCLLSACSLLHPTPTGPVHARRAAAELLRWQAAGKLGLHYQDRGGSLYFTWEQRPDSFTLDLAGPLGQGQTRLSGSPGLVTMENSSTGHLEADTAEALMQQALGWQAPVSYLRFWLRGLPATVGASVQKDADGNISQISEDGWQADIERYQQVGDFALPAKLLITGPDTRLTVVVSSWKPAP
jgi:outer membrane lipoprotein LolB